MVGSGFGSAGRAVASDIRGPRFESRHRQNLLNICLLDNSKNKEKKLLFNGPFTASLFYISVFFLELTVNDNYFLNGPSLVSFSFIFSLFQTNINTSFTN